MNQQGGGGRAASDVSTFAAARRRAELTGRPEDVMGGTSMSIVAHEDDDLLFQNPDISD